MLNNLLYQLGRNITNVIFTTAVSNISANVTQQ